MQAGAYRIDITPSSPVWMDGMLRAHKSVGVRHRLYSKAVALSSGSSPEDIFVIASADVCSITRADHELICAAVAGQSGVRPEHIILAATHTHSGPATVGFFNEREEEYTRYFIARTAEAITQAIRAMRPAMIGCRSGSEDTISHYRRLMSKNGRVIMNWEPYDPSQVTPLGEVDPELGILKAVSAGPGHEQIALIFNHAGHPNVMSGDNYLLSPDYPGLAEKIIEERLGGTAVFVNGAQGTMDIDGLRDRDWAGVDRVASALSGAAIRLAGEVETGADASVRGGVIRYTLKPRQITAHELEWADKILAATGGKIKSVADGVGDDYKADLFKRLHAVRDVPHSLEQVCVAVNDTAWLSFPGELFTEIGARIKRASPFARTYIVGLANGKTGYIPTARAIREGGYESDTRSVDESAEEIIVEQSLDLLKRLHGRP